MNSKIQRRFIRPTLISYWRQGSVILIAVVIGKIFSLAWKLVLARFGPQSLGTVEIALTIFFTLQAFSLLGLQTALIRFVSIASLRKKGLGVTYLLLSVKIAVTISLICIALFLSFPSLLTEFFHESASFIPLVLRYFWVVPVLVLSELLWSYLAATRHTGEYSVTKYVLPALTRLISLILLMGYGLSPHILITHLAVAAAITLLCTVAVCRKYIRWQSNALTTRDILPFLSFALPMSGSFLLFTLYGASDVWLIGHYLGPTSVGLLSAAMAIIDIPDIILIPMLNIFQVHLGPMYRDTNSGLMFTWKNIGIFIGIGCFFYVGVSAFQPFAVPILFGTKFESIIPLVSLLLLSKIAESAIILPLRHTLDFYGHTKTTLILMALATTAKLFTGLFTIPAYGLMGIVYMAWIGTGVHLIGTLISCRVRFGPKAAPLSR